MYNFYTVLIVCFCSRIQHGFGQFHLGASQNYYIIYEAKKYCLKVIVTQLVKTPDLQEQITSFKLFLELMEYLEDSIHSVMNLYIPSADFPVLHVACHLCDVATPHIMLGSTAELSLNFPPLCCAEMGSSVVLRRSHYLPFGDTLTYETFSK